MLSMHDLPITESVYTFVERNGKPTHIAASSLLKAIEGRAARGLSPYPVTQCYLSESLADALGRGELGVEPPHAQSLPAAALERPGIIGEWGKDHISIDGAHRLWRRWKRGDKWFPAYVVPEALWRIFTIIDMPGTGAEWDAFNRTAQIRTPDLERLRKLLGGK